MQGRQPLDVIALDDIQKLLEDEFGEPEFSESPGETIKQCELDDCPARRRFLASACLKHQS
mgnify:FL=1